MTADTDSPPDSIGGSAHTDARTGLPHTPPRPPRRESSLSRTHRARLTHCPSAPNLSDVDTLKLVNPLGRVRNFREFEQDYEVCEIIGTGGYAVVHRCRHRASGVDYAVKTMKVCNLARGPDSDSEEDDAERMGLPASHRPEHDPSYLEIMNELNLMQRLEHPNIVHLREYFIEHGKCRIVMTMLKGGELMGAICSHGSYSEQDAKVVMRHFTDAVAHMHTHGVVHRDLKLENLVLGVEGDLSSVTVVDFGIAKAARIREKLKGYCGTKWYRAPEILKAQAYTQKADAWSLGISLHVLLTGGYPFESHDDDELTDLICACDLDLATPYYYDVSQEGKDLLLGLLNPDPQMRLSAAQALEHTWFTGHERHTTATLCHVHARIESRFASALPTRRFQPGEFLVRQGQRSHSEVYLIQQGECQVFYRPPDGAASHYDTDADGNVHLGARRGGNFVGELGVAFEEDAAPPSPFERMSEVRRHSEAATAEALQGNLGWPPSKLRVWRAFRLVVVLVRARRRWVGRRRSMSVVASTPVDVIVLDRQQMSWAADHDCRLSDDFKRMLKTQRLAMRKKLRAELLRDRAELAERRSGSEAVKRAMPAAREGEEGGESQEREDSG